jgi:hypothetical protein
MTGQTAADLTTRALAARVGVNVLALGAGLLTARLTTGLVGALGEVLVLAGVAFTLLHLPALLDRLWLLAVTRRYHDGR